MHVSRGGNYQFQTRLKLWKNCFICRQGRNTGVSVGMILYFSGLKTYYASTIDISLKKNFNEI